MWPNVRIEPVLWLTWHEPGTPWCFLGLRTGPGHMNGCQTCWQMNQMGESGCLQTTQHTATKLEKHFLLLFSPSQYACKTCVRVFTKITWEKLYKNLLHELNQQASGVLFIFSQLKLLNNVLHLGVHLEGNKGQHRSPFVNKHTCYKLV